MKLEWLGEYRELVEAMIRFANNYANVLNKEFMGEDVKYSFSQIQVVEYLLENEENNQKMSEVAKRLGISTSAFTKLTNKLVNKGILIKDHREGNKKDIIIQVTPLGRSEYNIYSNQIANELFKQMFEIGKKLTKDELEIFTQMMRSLSSSLD